MTAFFCIQICQDVFRGHNITRQSLCSQDFMNFVEPIRDHALVAFILRIAPRIYLMQPFLCTAENTQQVFQPSLGGISF